MTRSSPVVVMAGFGLAAFTLAGMPVLAVAQSKDKPDSSVEDNGRYSLHQVGDKFIRLDSRTGAVTQCAVGPVGWTCNTVPDDRAALESEITRLQRENATLKQSLLARGVDLQSGAKPAISGRKDDPKSGGANEPRMPTEAEMDRALAFMKNVWRRLVEMMADLQRDMKKSLTTP